MDGNRDAIRYPWTEPPDFGQAVEVADGVLWLRLPLPMKLDHVNVYALDDGDGWTLVDTGMSTKRSRALWTDMLKGPLKGRPVKRVVVTHHHPDHMGLAGWFQKEHDATLVTTRTAWLFSRMLSLDEQERPTEETLQHWRRAGMRADIYEARLNDRPMNFSDVVYPMPLGFERVSEGDQITFGGRNWDVRIGNGHSPEHATFWSRDDNLVLAGDQLLPSISSNLGVYATEPMADPVHDWFETCQRFSEVAHDDHLVLGGHKLPFQGLPVRLRQLIDNHHGALKRLREELKEPKSAAECFGVLFKRSIGEAEYGLALVEAIAHVNHLYLAGQVTRTLREKDGAWLFQVA